MKTVEEIKEEVKKNFIDISEEEIEIRTRENYIFNNKDDDTIRPSI